MSSQAMQSRLQHAREDRDELFRSLEDLDQEFAAGDLKADDYHRLRDTYVGRAAKLVREVERLELSFEELLEGAHSVSEQTRYPSQSKRIRRQLGRVRARRLLLSLLVLWMITGATFLGLHFAGVRLPGQSETGSISLSEALVVQQQLTQATNLAGAGQISQAISLYGDILTKVPNQHQALTYRGWLIRVSGKRAKDQHLVVEGDRQIARAVRLAPGYPDARGLYGIALADDKGQFKSALVQFAALLRDHPSSQLLVALAPQVYTIYHEAGVTAPAPIARALAE